MNPNNCFPVWQPSSPQCLLYTLVKILENSFTCRIQMHCKSTVYDYRYRRQTHVTPKSYLSFLGGYQSIYNKKLHYFQNLARRMKTGLDKLIEATVSVDGLSKELVIKEKELEVANVKADTVRVIHCYHISFFNHSL